MFEKPVLFCSMAQAFNWGIVQNISSVSELQKCISAIERLPAQCTNLSDTRFQLVLPTGPKDFKNYDTVAFLCPRHKMARGHLVFALSVIPSFRPSVIPSFRHIKVCLLNSSYILAWI